VQKDLSKVIAQDQKRLMGMRDASLLPEFCAMQKDHLKIMEHNYEKLINYHARISRAKMELSHNLHMRMKWVVQVQGPVATASYMLSMYTHELKRLQTNLVKLEQLHAEPSMYVVAVVKVVCRRAFSNCFLERAGRGGDEAEGGVPGKAGGTSSRRCSSRWEDSRHGGARALRRQAAGNHSQGRR